MRTKEQIHDESSRAADEAYKAVMEQYAQKSEYVPFDGGKSVRRRAKGFDAYFYANAR